MPDAAVELCIEERLRAFETYDRAVDVVSAFEMIYTNSNTKVPATVRHFERFPRVMHGDGQRCTPDFSIVFGDGGGLAAEVARIALNDQSVEKLCKQLHRYDTLEKLPMPPGTQAVDYCDVLLFVPMMLGAPVVRRVLHDRLTNDEHWYKPGVAPCIVQFGFDEGRWIFQRIPDPANGRLREDGRADSITAWFDDPGQINTKPERFAEIKATRAFINDEVNDLYLATHLWAKTFPTMASANEDSLPQLLDTSVVELADDLRVRYGYTRRRDVRRAMDLLATAKLAESTQGDRWVVAWEKLQSRGGRELERILASRVCNPPQTSRLSRLRRAGVKGAQQSRKDEQIGLF